tara:strand:- start:88 stop:819 length:732 start_codon:yes stop_codon:yes gene_type:complete
MTPRDLLAVSPDFLAKTILHRREMMMQDLPSNLAKRQEERQIAANLAQDSKQRKDEISAKFNNLKNEVNIALESVVKLLSEINQICLDESGEIHIDRKALDLILDEQNLAEMSRILDNSESWCNSNIQSQKTVKELSLIQEKARKLILSGGKANDAKLELELENEQINSAWLENESHRRRCESRYTKLKRSNDETESAIEFWSSKINSDYEDLLTDARRVADGGPSSRYLMKQNMVRKNRRKQ